MMRTSTVASIAACLVLMTTTAAAGTAEYCRPYATKSTDVIIKFTWLRFYAACIGAAGNPAPLSTAEEVMKIIRPAPAVTPYAKPPGSATAIGSSGYAPGTPGWQKWCKRNYPQSFDAKHGTVILEIDNHGKRVQCPG